MRLRRLWWRAGGFGLVVASLVGLSGCLGFLHPVDASPDSEPPEDCRQLPKCCRDHIYVFLMNGLDPFNYGNLTGLRDYLLVQGISRTYYGQLYHYWWFTSEIRRIARQDPDAHFVLVGFSLGANVVHEIAEVVKPDGIHIDLVVFLSGNHPIKDIPKERPENVGRVLNLLADGLMGNRGELDYAENVRLIDTLHFGAPTHPTTVQYLSRELGALAATVPVEPSGKTPSPLILSDEPTPRPVRNQISTSRDEWDFLKPAARGREATVGSKQ
jgi:hypothetical protein